MKITTLIFIVISFQFVFSFLPGSVLGAQNVYYISSSEGNDINDGTYNNPWKTISKVNSFKFLPGDIIRFKRGDAFYDATLTINSSGTSSQRIKFATYGSDVMPIIGDSLLFAPIGYWNTTLTISGNYITLDSLEIRGGNPSSGLAGGVEISGNNVTVQNCKVGGGNRSQYRASDGIAMTPGSRNTNILNNEVFGFCNGIFNYGNPGVTWSLSDSVCIRYNIIHDNWSMEGGDADGIRLIGSYEGNTNYNGRAFVEYNEIYHWGEDAMDFNAAEGITIQYNNIHDPKLGVFRNDTAPAAFKCGGTPPSLPSKNMIWRYNIIHDLWVPQQSDGKFSCNAWSGGDMESGEISYNLVYNIYGSAIILSWQTGSSITAGSTIKIFNNTLISGGVGVILLDLRSIVELKNNIIISGFQVPGHSYTYPYPRNSTESAQLWHGTIEYPLTKTYDMYNWGLRETCYLDANLLSEGTIQNEDHPEKIVIGQQKSNLLGVAPQFNDEDNNDYTLTNSSPAIDYGIVNTLITDILGNNIADLPDIGAYEYGSTQGSSNIRLNIKVLLEGPFSNGSMSAGLLSNGYLPLTQPYNDDPWNYNGNESVSSIPSGVIDWVLLELRSGTTSSTVLSRKAAFLKSDGSIVDLDGNSNVSFPGISSGSNYIVIRHRNHLPIMSSNPLSLSSSSALYDFTTGTDKAYGTNALADLGSGKWGMISGDGDINGVINVIDYGSVGNHLFESGYESGDLDLNGVVNIIDYAKTNLNLFKNSQVPN